MGRSPAIIPEKKLLVYSVIKLTISLLKFYLFLFNLSQHPMVQFCQQDPCQQISNTKIYHIAPPPPRTAKQE